MDGWLLLLLGWLAKLVMQNVKTTSPAKERRVIFHQNDEDVFSGRFPQNSSSVVGMGAIAVLSEWSTTCSSLTPVSLEKGSRLSRCPDPVMSAVMTILSRSDTWMPCQSLRREPSQK